MADLARALQTPVPGQQPVAPSQPPIPAAHPNATERARDAKNERARLRRKAQRAATLKAAEMPKKKKRKAKKKTADIYTAMKKAAARNPMKRTVSKSPLLAAPYGKKKKRGRPPGAKNKPKVGLAVALVPAPGVLRGRVTAALLADNSLLARIQQVVALLVAMPEHARKVVLDAVK